VDRFHNPRAIRYFRGRHSPEGYFRDSFNYDALIGNVLEPLGPGGSRQYRPATFDYKTDEPVISPLLRASEKAVLLVDGVFLLRPELRQYWDFSIFLDVTFDVATQRMATRDGIPSDNRRYVDGQRLYLNECRPQSLARVVIDNNDIANPVLFFNP
jgi:uridine kinase